MDVSTLATDLTTNMRLDSLHLQILADIRLRLTIRSKTPRMERGILSMNLSLYPSSDISSCIPSAERGYIWKPYPFISLAYVLRNHSSSEIDLSRVAQQAVAYKADDLRDPFARTAAEVRLAQQAAASDSLDLTLNGTIRADDRSLAIIDGKVYGPGDSVSAGVSVVSVRAEAVVLAHGSKQVTLTLSRPQLAVGSH